MAPVGTLWGFARQRQSKVILSVAALNKLELEQPQFTFQNKPAAFTTKFTYGKVPAFEGADGLKLIEGTTIARYLSSIGTNVNLLGSNPQEVAIIDQWTHFAEHEIAVPVHDTTGLVYGYYGTFNLERVNKNAERLAARPSGYVALDVLTLVDVVLVGVVWASACVALGSAERAQYPHIFAHYTKVTADVRLKQYWGTQEWVDVRATEPKTFTF